MAALCGMSPLVKDTLSDMWDCLIIHMEGNSTKVQILREGQPQSCTTKLLNINTGPVHVF